jgi:hypothetical protein
MLELLSSAAVLKDPIRPIFTALPSLTAEDADPDRPEPPEPPVLELLEQALASSKVDITAATAASRADFRCNRITRSPFLPRSAMSGDVVGSFEPTGVTPGVT